jgi:lysophospholipase L1-like esterase
MKSSPGLGIVCLGDSLTAGRPGAAYLPLLRNRLPQDRIEGRGRGGETVLSLLRSLQEQPLAGPVDLALLWIGVNDVYVRTARRFRLLKRLRRQPWARDADCFESAYRRLCAGLARSARRLLLVPPLLIGEDLDNPWNRELEERAGRIRRISRETERAGFVDLRAPFIERLAGRPAVPYTPRRLKDLLRKASRPGTRPGEFRAAENRGFLLTVDGVHLNDAGAELAAGVIAGAVEAARAALPPV